MGQASPKLANLIDDLLLPPEVRRDNYLRKVKELRAQAETAVSDLVREDFVRIDALYERMAQELPLSSPPT